jgi:soluble lytic murein transglycosylase-like protein
MGRLLGTKSGSVVRVCLCVLTTALVMGLLAPAPAQAELVRLTNGRIISVASCRFDGEFVVLEFRGGGEVRAPKDLIAELMPDEVPYARALALEALAMSAAASGPQLAIGEIRSLVSRIAEKWRVPEKLAHALVQTESNYEPRAVSPKGAMGLMQLMPVVAEQYAVADPFNAEANLEAGMRHLRGLLDRFPGRLTLALAAYNAGEGAVSRYNGVPPYRETQDYVRRIQALVR